MLEITILEIKKIVFKLMQIGMLYFEIVFRGVYNLYDINFSLKLYISLDILCKFCE